MPPTTRGWAKRPLEESTGNGIGSPASTAPAPRAKKAKKQTTLSFARVEKPAEEQPSPRAMGTTPSATVVAAAVVATPTTEQDEPKQKKQRKAPAAKTPATKTDRKVYDDAIKAVDKTFKALHKKYKPNPNPFRGVTADDFSKAMAAQFLPIVQNLSSSGSPLLAINLLLYMADHCYGDLEAWFKSSGWGDTDEPFKEMDKALLSLIPSLPVPSSEGFALQPSKSDFGTEESEIRNLESIKKKEKRGFNKQERGWLDSARVKDLHAMFQTRHERREKVASEEHGDWAGNALNDLVETRMRIDGYGIGKYYFGECA